MFRSTIASIGLCFALIAKQTLAYCIEDWACYQLKSTQNGLEARVENRQPFPITLTLELTTENLQLPDDDSGSYTFTTVLPGLQKATLASLYKQNPSRPFRVREAFYWTPGNMNAKHDDSYRYLKPYSKDRNYPIVQGYGGRYSHTGSSRYALDFAMPQGTPVHAARGGVVIDLAEHHSRGGSDRRLARYANFVTILHDDNTTGEYYHLQRNGVLVERGQHVQAGQLIGLSGNTGFSSLPHLHFAVYKAKSHGDFESIPIQFQTSK